jgi:hypothetical protein
MYKNIEISEDNDDIAMDISGYTGNFHRAVQKNLQDIRFTEMASIIK